MKLSHLKLLSLLTSSMLSCASTLGSEILQVGMPNSIMGGLGAGEAKIAMSQIIKGTGISGQEFEVTAFEDHESFIKAIRNKEIDFFPIRAIHYFDVAELVDPVAVTQHEESAPRIELVTLVRQDHPAQKMADLKGKALMRVGVLYNEVSALWLTASLREKGLANDPDEFFESVTVGEKTGEVLLPVFFGKADACIVSEEGWQLLAELNPQLGQQLRVIDRSEPLVYYLLGFRSDYRNSIRDEFLEDLLSLHETPGGRQILMVTKTKAVVPFELDWLESVKRLLSSVSEDFPEEISTNVPLILSESGGRNDDGEEGAP